MRFFLVVLIPIIASTCPCMRVEAFVRRNVLPLRRQVNSQATSVPSCLNTPTWIANGKDKPWRQLNSLPDLGGWTVQDVIEDSVRILQINNVTEPEMSTHHLLASAMNLSWETGFRDVSRQSFGSTCLTDEQAQEYTQKLSRRLMHEPLQYILGQWDFLDYTVSIRSPLLCPRPETEELVMKIVQETTESPVHILDVGCGTGVIGLALAEQLPDATVDAIDIDPIAVETSTLNKQRVLGPSQQSCYKAILSSAANFDPDHHYDIVVSNPPYIPRADMETLAKDVVGFENDQALCGGDDGLDVVRTIVQKLPLWCNSGAVCWMEVDPTHPTMIKDWLAQEPRLDGVEYDSSFKDMFGKDRFVKLRVR